MPVDKYNKPLWVYYDVKMETNDYYLFSLWG